MGQGGFITLVNSTNTDWRKTHEHSYQMNSWSFPDSIPSGTSVNVYVEWDQGIFTHESDDAGEVNYTLSDSQNSTFQIQARASKGFQLQAYMLNIETKSNPKGSVVPLGWNHDGYVSFVLFGKQGDYSSTYINGSSWMQDNFDLIGNKKLNEICIAGSHDSGMSVKTSGTLGGFDCNTLTQSKNVLGQLMSGARYFDIRPVISAGKFLTGHYSHIADKSWQGANGQSIQSIIDDLNTFTQHNNELVVLNFSHSLNTDLGNNSYRAFNQDEWNKLFAELNSIDHLYVVNNNPDIDLTKETVSSFIQGKPAVILVLEESGISLGNYEGKGFFYYKNFDVYNSYADKNEVKPMAENQFKKMKEQSGKSYFLLSWTLTQDATQAATCFLGTASSIKELADEANQQLASLLYPQVPSSGFPNIIYTDNILNSNAAAMAMAVNWKVLVLDAVPA